MWGAVCGFVALFISATVFWLTGVKQVWWCAVIFAGVTAIALPIFYFGKYRPSVKDVARRVDDLGLEERTITMEQLKDDTSTIAVLQRQDGIAALARVHSKMIKFIISVPLVVALSVSAFLGAGMTTVSALAAAGIIKMGNDVVDDIVNPPEEYTITYGVEGEGEIQGGAEHIVVEGQDAPKVTAVPAAEWAFLEWSDGLKTPYRWDQNVKDDIVVRAIFTPLEGGDETEPEDEEAATDVPHDFGDQSQPPSMDDNGSQKYDPENQVFNGQTYYGGSTYETQYKDAIEQTSKDNALNGDQKDVISKYWDVIEKKE